MAMTWDPGRLGPKTTLSAGNLVATAGAPDTYPVGEAVFSTIALTGTGVIGFRANVGGLVFGIADSTATGGGGFPGVNTHGFASYSSAGQMVYNGALTGSSPTWTGGDLVEMNYDIPGQQIRFRVNGGAYGSFQSFSGKLSGSIFVSAGFYHSGETLTLVSFPQTLTPALVTNSNTFYAPAITRGAVDLAPSLFANTNTFYSPTVTQAGGTQTLTPSLFTNANSFYSPAITVGAVTLSPSLFTNPNTFYAATVTPGAVTLTPARFDNASTFYGPVVTRGAVTLSPGLLANASVLYAPTVTQTSGAQALLPNRFDNDNTFYAPSVSPGAVALSPSRLNNANTFFSPTVIQPGGAQFLLPGLFVNQSVIYLPTASNDNPPGTYPLAIEGDPTTIRRSLVGGGSVVAGSIPSTGRVIVSALRGRP